MQQAKIQIEGRLDEKWADWFDGFDLKYTDTGNTILNGKIVDQATLYGLIAKLRDLGVKIISVSFESPTRIKTKKRR